jgi:ubiquinone/menaquinone biosynthesis C-methylase UbiE
MSTSLIQALSVVQKSQHYNQWIYSLLEPYLSGVVLDIGSGLGEIASLFVHPQVKEVIISDCNKELILKLEQRMFFLEKYSLAVLDITKDDCIAQFKGREVDTITCVNVLEHIKDDISALHRMRDILKPDGRVVILAPALSCLYGSLDACHGHQRRYTPKILKAKMQIAGFDIEDWRYINFFGVITWFLTGRVLKQKKFSEKACCQLDKIVPFLRSIEQGFRPPWGQSLVMVGRVSKMIV